MMKKIVALMLLAILGAPAFAAGAVHTPRPFGSKTWYSENATPSPSPEPTPEPTPKPTTKPSFNYAAIVADPDAHTGYLDYMVGTVQQYNEYDYQFGDYDHFYGILISVDDVLLQAVMIYFGYNDGEDHPVVGDTVWAYGAFGGLEDRTGILGTLKIPWYICTEVRIIADQN